MALSGTFYTNVGSHWRLQIDWSATQNVSTNQSTITTRLYWIALDSYGAISSSSTKDCGTTIDGTTDIDSAAGKASLSANQKKLIQIHSKTITHNTDGTKSVGISAYFDAEVTLGGTYYGRISVSGSATLNTIPRESALTSTPSWIAGNSLAVSIGRSSTSFTHDLSIRVNGVTIKTITGIATGITVTFDSTETENIFKELAKNTTNFDQATSLILTTKNGSTTIGSKTYSGTCSSPNPTTLLASDFNIGDTVPIEISESNSNFTHTISATLGSFSTTITTQTNLTSISWNTVGIISNLYTQLPSTNNGSVTLTCLTYYGTTQVRSATTKIIVARVTNSNPTFTNSYTYKDTNSAIAAITGNDQFIVQNKSTVLVEILTSAKATAINGATMSSYVATLNGVSITQPYSSSATVSFNFGVVNSNTNLTLSIRAIDSRGNSTTATKTITVLPYSNPLLTITANRTNNFDASTILKVSGSFSTLSVSGVNKNNIQTLQYRYKDSSSPTWGSWIDITFSTSATTFSATDVTITLDNLKAWNIEVQSIDKFSTTISSKTVPIGKPILFIDSKKQSVGINKFPASNNTFEVSGNVVVDNSINITNPSNSSSTYNMSWLNNIPRIQFNGATNGFQIQGDSNSIKFSIDNSGHSTIQTRLTVPQLRLTSLDYLSGTSTTHGLTIGDNSGYNLKLDTSEVSAFEGSNSSDLYLNHSGGTVNISTGLQDRSAYTVEMFGSLNIHGQGSNTLRLYGQDHTYMEFYAGYGNGITTRSGFLGYSSSLNNNLQIGNEIGNVTITTSNTGLFLFRGTTDSHSVLQAEGRAILKWLSSAGDTLQVRNSADNAYAPIHASAFTVGSTEASKTNIAKMESPALEIVNSATIYNYQLADEFNIREKGAIVNIKKPSEVKVRTGLLHEEAPKEIIHDEETIDLYSMSSVLWKAVQELSSQVNYLKKRK